MSAHKDKKREEMKRLLQQIRDGVHPYATSASGHRQWAGQINCFSATCEQCGKVWLSAIKPIKPNGRRGARRVYICDRCR